MGERLFSGAVMSGPAENFFSITPSDSVDLIRTPRAIYIGGAGNVVVRITGEASVTFQGLAAGTILPIRCDRVLATGTTATNLVGLD
jgi:hypothetical protein